MKRIAILGSTGSIGTQTLDIVRQLPQELKVVSLAAATRGEELKAQAAEFGISKIALSGERAASHHGLPGGMDRLVEMATDPDVDVVVVSVAGVIGLLPTLAAIRERKRIALASKEVLVAAGEIVMPMLREFGATMTPIDSEHSAIFQCLQGYPSDQLDSLILTASGGPFRGKKREDLAAVTVDQALNHPTWRMGGKITIDSASLMNKALEMIEARWLFDVPMDKVELVVHPQSIIHSMVRFKDQSVLGQLGFPDMRIPIQYALLYPDRTRNQLPKWNPAESAPLTFEPLDETTFRGPTLARDAMEIGKTAPCAFNAANEVAVAQFLAGEIGFLEIYDRVEAVLQQHQPQDVTLDTLIEVDHHVRETMRA
jgi:1-deoxy-D-xylulose-5-phosphate reductoisomerase